MNIKEEYVAPQLKTVNLSSERVICQVSVNQTESLDEDKFDW